MATHFQFQFQKGDNGISLNLEKQCTDKGWSILPAVYPCKVFLCLKLLPCTRMRSRVMHLVASVCACAYFWLKRLFEVLPLTKSPVSVTYCSFVKFSCQKGAYYTRRFERIHKLSIKGMGEGFGKLYYGKLPHLVYMQCRTPTCNCSASLVPSTIFFANATRQTEDRCAKNKAWYTLEG